MWFILQNKKAYEKSFKEAEKANDTFVKIDADINLSRADVEKVSLYIHAFKCVIL